MVNKWETKLLGDLCREITVGFVGSMTQEYVDNGIPFLRSKNINEYEVNWNDMKYVSSEFHQKLSKSRLKPGDVAIVRTGKPGTTCVVPEELVEANCSDIVIARVDDKQLSAHYLSYFMNAMAHGQVNAHIVGAVQQHFNVGSAKKLEIPLPSREEQEDIVSVLKAIDDKRRLNRQINQTLEQMAQTLLKSWFVDFDPVIDNALDVGSPIPDGLQARAELRKAVRGSEGFKSLPDDIRQLFPNEFEESELGWVPKGWDVSELSDITTELRRGISPKYLEDGGIQVINQKCIRNHEVNFELCRRNNPELRKVDGRELQIGDVLVNSTGVGTLGRIAQVTHLPEATVVDSHVTVVRVNPLKCPINTFGQLMLASEKRIEALGVGSTGQTELSRKLLSEQKFIIPPYNIAQYVESMFLTNADKIASNSKQIGTLTKLRDTLLPKLISGELRLDEAKTELEQAVTA